MNYSVLMAVWAEDDPEMLKVAIDSCLVAKDDSAEFILVADGPLSPQLDQVVNSYSSIRVIRLADNVGLARALNFGLNFCNSKFIMRADADDISTEDRFVEQLRLLEDGYDIVSSYIYELSERQIINRNLRDKVIKKIPINGNSLFIYSLFRNPINHNSVAYRKEKIIKLGGYPELYLKEDYGLWIKAINNRLNIKNTSEIHVLASAGHQLIKRRRGAKYLGSEIELFLFRIHYEPKILLPITFLALLLRLVIFVSPAFLHSLVVNKFLRSQK